MFRMALVSLLLLALAGPIRGEVVKLEITERAAFAGGHRFGNVGPYERVKGWLTIEVDPTHARHRRITDIELARTNDRNRVEFRTEFFLLKPLDPRRGNGRILYDVNNRGNKLAVGAFNGPAGNRNDPKTLADAGNGFLMRQGYSVLWCGWNGDVRPGGNRIMVELPVVKNRDGSSITSKSYAEICVTGTPRSQPLYWGNSVAYPAVSLDNGTARLTRRPYRTSPPEEVPHDEWSFARVENGQVVSSPGHLHLRDGFRSGWIYELVYTGKDPRVTGLGLVAARDCISFFRFAKSDAKGVRNPLADAIQKAYIFGISQSGRFIHHFLFEAMNTDETGRMVLDGAMPHVGGGGKGQFNYRFAQTTRHGSQHQDNLFASDFFPFNSVPQVDPVTGRKGDSFAVLKERGHLPKVFFTETSAEYWSRAASLLHTDTVGKTDAGIDPNLRLYFFTGAQHGVSGSTSRGIFRNPGNDLNHYPLLRALLVALDRWVTSGVAPPPSAIPRIADETLVELAAWRKQFPELPGVTRASVMFRPLRLNPGTRWFTRGIADNVPPKIGPAYNTLVPAVDADGIERAGIKLPTVSVPLGTYTGWNVRNAAAGAGGMLGRFRGSWLAFAKTRAERESVGDPRRSVRERYPTRAEYMAKITAAVLALRRRHLLLDEDAIRILEKASRRDLWSE